MVLSRLVGGKGSATAGLFVLQGGALVPPFFDCVSLWREQAPALRQDGSIGKNSAVLFTFRDFCGTIPLVGRRIHKLAFHEEVWV